VTRSQTVGSGAITASGRYQNDNSMWLQSLSFPRHILISIQLGTLSTNRPSAAPAYDILSFIIVTRVLICLQTTYLGRPWADYARVVFQQSTLGANV
jgi:hypothetical protein